MKYLLLLIFISLPFLCLSQVQGQWVWKSGSDSLSYPGHYGIQGVTDSLNAPPGLYEACEWTDSQGNFWLYGGWTTNRATDDLWKFDPVTNKWTWMKGHNDSNQTPIYGNKGVPSAANTPGGRIACYSWSTKNGDLWLFGGFGGNNDLWKYNISIGNWTWMKGDTSSGGNASYGIKGIENPLNQPRYSFEMGISWTGDNDDLWMLDNSGCLWRYNILTNNWTWMKGTPPDTTYLYTQPVFGSKGVFDSANSPGSTFFDYTRWKDSNGNLWYLHGQPLILWEYDVASNRWAWIDGDTVSIDYYYGTEICMHSGDEIIKPFIRKEARACWIDNCNNLWVMGGYGYFTSNDLVYFDMADKQWVWAGNDTVELDYSIFGTKGVSSPANKPCSRTGAIPFKDLAGNLWLFGGLNSPENGFYSDLWMYTIDTTCTKCHIVTGISEIKNVQNIKISPNPTSSTLSITCTNKISQITITNLLGQTLFTRNFNSEQVKVDVADLPQGVYLLKINGTEVKKFVKE